MIDISDMETLIEDCFNEISLASREKYDSDKADRTAALFLMAQMKLSFVIEEVEMKAKNAKNEISRIEGEKYFEHLTTTSGKKPTEAAITSGVNKEPEVVKAKADNAEFESNLRKWNYLLNSLKDGHIYFRNLSKNKTWAE